MIWWSQLYLVVVLPSNVWWQLGVVRIRVTVNGYITDI
jgi:hypothetical protein